MLRISGLLDDSIVDGPGIRLTVFGQGCPHHCYGCHNPETWDFCGGCLIEEEKIVKVAKSNPLIRGITFSGGEPFYQAAGFTKLARLFKKEGYEVASYTGYTFEQLIQGTDEQLDLLDSIDVLIDGLFVLELKSLSLAYRGSSNQRILDAKKSMLHGKPIEINTPRWLGEY